MPKMPMKLVATKPEHEQFRLKVLKIMRSDFGDVDALEILMVMSQLVGQLIAMQDQRRYTSDMIMEMVSSNITEGNQAAMRELLSANTTGLKN